MTYQLQTTAERWAICGRCDERDPTGEVVAGNPVYTCSAADCCTGRIVSGQVPCPLGKYDVDVSIHAPHSPRKKWGHMFLIQVILCVITQTYKNWKLRILDDPDSTVDMAALWKQVERYWGGPVDPYIKAKVEYARHDTHLCGSKRQHLIDTETARMVVNFDDDDFYPPGYLAHQVGRLALIESPMLLDTVGSYYSLTDARRRQKGYRGCGAGSWAFWTEWMQAVKVKFPQRRVASDTTWFNDAKAAGVFGDSLKRPRPKNPSVVRSYHATNVSYMAVRAMRCKTVIDDPGMAWLIGQFPGPLGDYIRGEILPRCPTARAPVPPRPAEDVWVLPALKAECRTVRLALERFEKSARPVDYKAYVEAAERLHKVIPAEGGQS